MTATEEQTSFWLMHCSIIPPEQLRMLLVAVIGSTVAGISLVFNAFLFYVLVRRKRNFKTHLLYLTFMALIDVFLSASYILLFPVNLFMDYYESVLMSLIWWNLLRPMYALCHIAITASALLLTSATFERFLTVLKMQSKFPVKYRLFMSTAALFFALAAKGPMFFELTVVSNENCTGVTAFVPIIQEWAITEPYNTFYKFLFRSIVSTFLPFFLSLYFNTRIVLRLNQQHAAARLFRFATSEHRENVRSASRMLVLVACCYLACNVLNVIVTAWEFLDMDTLMQDEIRPYYTYSTDLVSLLTVFACAVRMPIYYACNARIQHDLNTRFLFIISIFKFCFIGRKLQKFNFSRDNTNICTIRHLNTGNDDFVNYSNTPTLSSTNKIKSKMSLNKNKKLNRTTTNNITIKEKNVEEKPPETKLVIGTGFDKIVIQLAIRSCRQSKTL